MKNNIFPTVYGIISAVLGFLAVVFIMLKTFRLNITISVVIAGIFALIFFVWSYFQARASTEIKRIVRTYNLTDQDLADLTGFKKSDFPIYHDKLQLILPKRFWPQVLHALRRYEEEQNKL
ncbi:hypothetical protein [Lactobacillus psittaci]|uniref:Uncharacterized protein n=1 Tax=Lactobacillus psittaci DSM 15354 TaxID=1122152 RepID=A0A0R1S6U0_9LACO|nr:hypothetical protein [Lactobacillus psittaci]KRL62035.1 hypothetical protein FC23_GL000411 [Lactobacillus psittaci DSM 15354]